MCVTVFADGVHYFPQEILIGELFNVTPGKPGAIFILKLFDFGGYYLFELGTHGLAALKLLAVDQYRIGSSTPLAVLFVIKNRKLAGNHNAFIIG
jgi:hypothetical protein